MCLSREDKTPCSWFASYSRFPHLLTHPPTAPPPPIENEVLCLFHYCTSWTWAWAAGAFWSGQHQNQSRTKLSPSQPWLQPASTDNASPQTLCVGKGKRKMSVRDINRMIGQYQRERWTEGKAQRSTDISFESHAAARCLILNGKKVLPLPRSYI